MSAVWGKAVGCRVILSRRKLRCRNGETRTAHADAIVPKGNIILLPLKPNMDFLSRSNQLVQIMYNCACFCLRNSDYVRNEPYERLGVSIRNLNTEI